MLAELSCAPDEVFQQVRADAGNGSVSEMPKSCCDSC